MESKRQTVSVSAKFSRQISEVEILRTALSQHLLPALGEAPTVSNANINAIDPGGLFTEQTTFSSLGEWLDALSRRAESYTLYLYGNGVNFNFTLQGAQVSVSLQGEPARSAEFRSRIEQFAASAGLKTIAKDPTVGFTKRVYYRLLSPISQESFQSLMLVVNKWGEGGNFTGSIVRKSNPDLTEEVMGSEQWQSSIVTDLANILSARYSSFRTYKNMNFDFQQIAGTLNLNATAPDAESVRGLCAEFERILNITPVQSATPPEGLRRERRQYYIKSPITKEGFQEVLDLLEKYPSDPRSFNGTIRVEGKDLSFQDQESWRDEIEKNWTALQTVTYSKGLFQDNRFLTLDFERQQVALMLQVSLDATAQKGLTFQEFESELKLEPVKGRPYQYFRFARKYTKLEDWNKEADVKLADAIDHAVATAFPGGRYALVSASFKSGEKAEEQVACSSKDEFVGKLRAGIDYRVGEIVLQGPRGWDLTVRLERANKTVVIRSAISDAGEFKEAIAGFTGIQDLELRSSDDRPAQDAAPKGEKTPLWKTLAVPALTGVLAFVAALFTAGNGLASHKSTLTITVPAKSANGEVQVIGSEVPVRWVVLKNGMTHGDQPEEVPATISVSREGPKYSKDYSSQRPGALIDFPAPGVYYITVRPESGSAPEQSIRTIVKKDETKDPAKP